MISEMVAALTGEEVMENSGMGDDHDETRTKTEKSLGRCHRVSAPPSHVPPIYLLTYISIYLPNYSTSYHAHYLHDESVY